MEGRRGAAGAGAHGAARQPGGRVGRSSFFCPLFLSPFWGVGGWGESGGDEVDKTLQPPAAISSSLDRTPHHVASLPINGEGWSLPINGEGCYYVFNGVLVFPPSAPLPQVQSQVLMQDPIRAVMQVRAM